MLPQLLNKNLDIIFLVYGAAFFSMGIAILTQRYSKDSSFEIADIIWLLAFFGLIHGVNEWLDMIAIIKGFNSTAWNLTTTLILTLSFIILIEFGRRLMRLHTNRFLNKWSTVTLALAAIIFIIVSKQPPSIYPRYLLGFPAGIFSAFGFYYYYRDNKKFLVLLKLRNYFLAASISLGIYSLLTGIVTPKGDFFPACVINYASFSDFFGIPVQLLRGICALIISWSVYNILHIFNWENAVELKSALQEVTAAKVYVDNILKSIIDTLIVVDSKAKIRVINKTGCEILGYQQEEILGKPIIKLFKKKSFFQGKTLRNFIEKGALKNYEVACFAKDKSEIPMLFSGSVIRNASGNIESIVGVGKDMRELKNLQHKLVEAEKFAAMGKVSGIIGHELKNQLGIMRNAVYYIKLKLQNTDEKINKYLNMLDDEIVEIDRTIENILTFAKTRQPEFKNVDLKTLLLDVIEKIPIPKGITLTTGIEDNLPEISADQLQISRVFINILLNALDAMKKEGKLDISIKHINGNIFIRFKDTGSGINEENISKIFEPFFSTKTKGTGLGLVTSKMIIEAHGGNIEIESAVNKGTSVVIKLPINQHRKVAGLAIP